MPEYEFECTECKKTFTAHQTISERDTNPPPQCPSCGSTKVCQLLSGAAVITSKKS